MRPLLLAVGAALACTAQNPAFDTGDEPTSTSGKAPLTSSTSDATTSTASIGDPTTGSLDTSSGGDDDPNTTSGGSEEPREPEPCCGPEECAPSVRGCVCDINPACCDVGWTDQCAELAVACNGVCDGNLRPCCIPHEEPACTGVQLMPFCLTHATCCSDAWTPECVVDYDLEFGTCDLDMCEVPHVTPGCRDADVMACVCGGEGGRPQCCEEVWDSTCVDLAADCMG